MSYDYSVWMRKEVKIEDSEFHFSNGSIFIDDCVHVESEDIPPELLLAYEGIEWLVKLYVEPMNATENIIKKADSLARSFAKNGEGFVVDEQRGKILGKKIEPIKINTAKNSEKVWLNIFSEPNFAFADRGKEILQLFKKYLPNAMPRRYGLYEPPQKVFIENTKTEFLDFWKENVNIVWYSTKPVTDVLFSDAYGDRGVFKNRWKCNRISIVLDAGVLEYANWRLQLEKVLYELMSLLGGFYGDICMGRLQTQGGFWKGIPLERGICFALGQPYLRELGVTDQDEIRMFSGDDIVIPTEFCYKTEVDKRTKLLELVRADKWPFEEN